MPEGTGKPALQWSHVFSDMVSIGGLVAPQNCRPASMEPCLFRHGKMLHTLKNGTKNIASMEPCLFRHGKMGICFVGVNFKACFNGAMSFQTW